MKKLKSYEIRQMWLDFFESKGHYIMPSASLVPVNDPTLLWINAGVAPLKKFFDGREIPQNRRIVNAQKSIRTNDIDNVGKTARHHTFFEMLGNFSIGDYFREEALTWAYEILTSPKWFDFDIDRLYFTIYPDDIDSFNKWVSLGVKEDHIIKLEDNFWEIGEGPCGPDTEVFFDRGEKYDPQGLGIKMLKEDIENDRYIEIWNIVFSQFNSKANVKRADYQELPSKNIDTGMGLERMACVMQEVETNYETDLFMPIINEVENLTNVKYTGQMAFKVIADHIRSVTFAVSDGAILSNEGRGYVLRRILRRAVRYGKKLGMSEAFMYKLVPVVCNYMSNFYPYLLDTANNVSKVIKLEEEKFLLTLETGEKKLLDYISSAKTKVIPASIAFLLYDTFGFPIELTLEVASESNFEVDLEGFKKELEHQKQLSRNARSDDQSMNTQNEDMMAFNESCEFLGYESLECSGKVIAIFKDGKLVKEANGNALIVFDKTVFYAESGGQVGDVGHIIFNNEIKKVINTIKLPNFQHASLVQLDDVTISVNDEVHEVVSKEFRSNVEANHSATHLLNEALRCVLGKHVIQQGSSVTDKTLRFDFNNYTFPTSSELFEVERLVKEQISLDKEVVVKKMKIDEAKKMNVQAVFGEKYGDIVRVVEIGFSKELCGGTHVEKTLDIKEFAILSIESKGSGIYRIEATTNSHASDDILETLKSVDKEIFELENKINNLLTLAKKEGIVLEYSRKNFMDKGISYQTIVSKNNEVKYLREVAKEVDKAYNKAKKNKNTLSIDDYLTSVEKINGHNVLILKLSNLDIDIVKDFVDRLSDKLDNSIVFVANGDTSKVVFICKNKISSLHAGNLVKEAAIITKGNGGGRSDFAQAGGKDVSLLNEALEKVSSRIKETL